MRITLSSSIKTTSLVLLAILIMPPREAVAQKRPIGYTRNLAAQEAKSQMRSAVAALPPSSNQLGFDVLLYALDLDIDPTAQTVSGTVVVKAEVLADSMADAELDLLSNMTVYGATSNGGFTTFARIGDILRINLDRTYYLGESFDISVSYGGTPVAGAFGFDTYSGDPMIWSLSEPFGARTWWPCKDYPEDKADEVEVIVTVPDTLTVVSNGSLMDFSLAGGLATYRWHESHPIASYLVSVAIHPYSTFSHWYKYAPTDSMEVIHYVFPDHYAAIQSTYAKTVPMIEVFAGLFGEYPFVDEKYGHAEFLWGGGMEHQTVSSMGHFTGTGGEYLVAHELAHQWWGDMITCRDFHHIWLNEGFATYSEALWSEATYGEATYHSDMAAARYLGGGTIYVVDDTDQSLVFHSGRSYNKGSWVLHMLRHVVGDATFFTIMQTYYGSSHQYGTATTEDFQAICESVSGMNLEFFFHEWIYEEYYPTYGYEWNGSDMGGTWDVTLAIEQKQTNYIFKMPVDINITTTGGDTTIVVWDSLATQSFTLTVNDEPTAVALDKDEWILRSVEPKLADPTFHRGILLVNGVHFPTYGSEITSAYADSAFTGCYPFTFWDVFPEPGGGYPSELPAPIGHGAVPADTIEEFSVVVWVGNNYAGDLPYWYDTPVLSYLNAGGNVLLMTRYGQEFMTETLRDYLGINWAESAVSTLYNCVATYPGLGSMALTGTQSYNAVFDTSLATSESKLLFKETASFGAHRGLGVWRKPAGGGFHRTTGAQFAYVSGRPYRYDHTDLGDNVEVILGNLFGEPKVPVAAPQARPVYHLAQNYPNPFNPYTTIDYRIAEAGHVSLRVYNVAGQLVRVLVDGVIAPKSVRPVVWDGRDQAGVRVSSGVYFYRLVANNYRQTRKMVLLK